MMTMMYRIPRPSLHPPLRVQNPWPTMQLRTIISATSVPCSLLLTISDSGDCRPIRTLANHQGGTGRDFVAIESRFRGSSSSKQMQNSSRKQFSCPADCDRVHRCDWTRGSTASIKMLSKEICHRPGFIQIYAPSCFFLDVHLRSGSEMFIRLDFSARRRSFCRHHHHSQEWIYYANGEASVGKSRLTSLLILLCRSIDGWLVNHPPSYLRCGILITFVGEEF